VTWALAAVVTARGFDAGSLMKEVAASGGHISRSQTFALLRAASLATPPRLTAVLCAALQCNPGDLMPAIAVSDSDRVRVDPIPAAKAAHLRDELVQGILSVEPRFGEDEKFSTAAVQRAVDHLRDRRRRPV
jgi:DNA-binding Xre family transcriptional regulator